MTISGKTGYLFFIAGTAALGGFLFGFDTAVISGTIPFVTVQFNMDAIMEGWFVSSALVGCIAGVSFAGKASDTFGRKKVLIFSALLFSISAFSCMIAGTSVFLFIYQLFYFLFFFLLSPKVHDGFTQLIKRKTPGKLWIKSGEKKMQTGS